MGRWEDIVRSAVHERCREWFGADSLIVDEFWLPLSHERVDVAVIGSQLVGIEIKTHMDTLRRLERQAVAYSRVFEQCIACVAEPHAKATIDSLPEWWTVLAYEPERPDTMRTVRSGRNNPGLDRQTLVRLLWKSEVRDALLKLDCDVDPASGRHALWSQLLDRVSTEALSGLVRHSLRTRDAGTARIPTKRFTGPLAQAS